MEREESGSNLGNGPPEAQEREQIPAEDGEWFASDVGERIARFTPDRAAAAQDAGEWFEPDKGGGTPASASQNQQTVSPPAGTSGAEAGGAESAASPKDNGTWAEADITGHIEDRLVDDGEMRTVPLSDISSTQTIVVALIDRRPRLPDGSPPVPDPVEDLDTLKARIRRSSSLTSPRISPKDVIHQTLSTTSAAIHAVISPAVQEGSCGRVLVESIRKQRAAEWTLGCRHVAEPEELPPYPPQPMPTWRLERTHLRASLARSAYFATLLRTSLASAKRVEVSVRDPWTSVDALGSVLRFLEGDASFSDCPDAFQLLAAARLLVVPEAVREAVARIEECLGPHNIIRALRHARQYASVELQDKCANFLYKYLHVGNAAQMVSSVFDSNVDHREVARYLRNMPRDCFRELAVCRRRSIQHYFRPRPCYSMCIIKRQKSLDGNWAVYKLFEEHTMKFLLSAARDISSGHLYISDDDRLLPCPHDFQRDQIIAVLEANAFDTQYTMYDNGYDCTRLAASLPGIKRREIGVVTYDTSLTMSSPRSIVAVFAEFLQLPEKETQDVQPAPPVQRESSHVAAEDSSDEEGEAKPQKEEGVEWGERFGAGGQSAGGGKDQGKFRWGLAQGQLRACLGGKSSVGVAKVVNMEPRWNETLGSYSLNFYSRVKKASKKNFLLVPEGDENNIICLFGKMSRDTYALDFRPPLSCVQAFMTALSSFEHKMGIS